MFRLHRLVQVEYRARMSNPQEAFEAATQLLLEKFPSPRENTYDDDEWLTYKRYIPQVLALMKNYNDSQSKPRSLVPTMDFVSLLAASVKCVAHVPFSDSSANFSSAIHDNDTTNANPGLLDTARIAFWRSLGELDMLVWAFVQSLQCMYHLGTGEFALAEREGREALKIRKEELSKDDLLISLSYSWLGMALGGQERYDEALDLLPQAGKILEGPAGEAPSRKMVWRYNTSRNYYCMGSFEEAEELLDLALAEAEKIESWYQQV